MMLCLPYLGMAQPACFTIPTIVPNVSSTPYTPPTPDVEYMAEYGITSSGGLVSQWDDHSGHTRHATATGTARPTISGSGYSTIVTFDGTSDFMSASYSTAAACTVTIIMVVQPKNFGAFGKIFIDGLVSTSMSILDGTSSPNITLYNGAALGAENTNATLNVTKIIIAVYAKTASSISVNDGTKTTNATNAMGDVCGANGVTLGAGGGGSFFLNCDIQYVGIYFSALSSATQTSIYNYWKAYYHL